MTTGVTIQGGILHASTPAEPAQPAGAPPGPEAGTPAPGLSPEGPPAPDAAAQPVVPPANPAAEVIERRTGQALAKLMREKQDLDARSSQVKKHEARLAMLDRADALAAAGDHSAANMLTLEATYGSKEKAKEALPSLYESLTSEIIGVQSKVAPKVERDLSRLERRLEQMELEREKALAERDAMAARDREQRVEQGVKALSTMLEQQSNDYPYLMAEADDPGHVVWEIMVAAIERGEEPPEPEEAAKLANQYYQPVFERKKTRYQNLLAPQGASGTPSKPEGPQNTPGPPRKSLTNATSAQAPNLTAPAPITDREKSIDAAWKHLQEAHKQ